MTDFDIEVGAHDAEITFGELNMDISFNVTLAQFLETLEHIFDDPDVSGRIVRYVTRQAEYKYEDEKVFSNNQALDTFLAQLRAVMG